MDPKHIEQIFMDTMLDLTRKAVQDFDKQFIRPRPVIEQIC